MDGNAWYGGGEGIWGGTAGDAAASKIAAISAERAGLSRSALYRDARAGRFDRIARGANPGCGRQHRGHTNDQEAQPAQDHAACPGEGLRDAAKGLNHQVASTVQKRVDSLKKKVAGIAKSATGAGRGASEGASQQRDAA